MSDSAEIHYHLHLKEIAVEFCRQVNQEYVSHSYDPKTKILQWVGRSGKPLNSVTIEGKVSI
jgi:hypothetical protein